MLLGIRPVALGSKPHVLLVSPSLFYVWNHVTEHHGFGCPSGKVVHGFSFPGLSLESGQSVLLRCYNVRGLYNEFVYCSSHDREEKGKKENEKKNSD